LLIKKGGKSAILVALAIGLGAKAGFTNRGSKLTDLIRAGARLASVEFINQYSSARIIIKLRNKGAEAYRPKEYGSSIIVERTINSQGSGGYKLKDSTGKKTIATTFSELSLILEQFNIQINNPYPCSQILSILFLTMNLRNIDARYE
jgi:chromosome segregation ATPase